MPENIEISNICRLQLAATIVPGVAEGRWENTKVKPEWRGVTLRLLGGRGVLRDGGETRQPPGRKLQKLVKLFEFQPQCSWS